MRSTLGTALLFALGAAPALAGGPQERVRQTVDAVSAVVNDPQLQASSKEHDRRERVVKVMHESFDFGTMARESLGPHWAGLAPEQREDAANARELGVLRVCGGRYALARVPIDRHRAGVSAVGSSTRMPARSIMVPPGLVVARAPYACGARS